MAFSISSLKKVASLFLPYLFSKKQGIWRYSLIFLFIIIDISSAYIVPLSTKYMIDTIDQKKIALIAISCFGLFWTIGKLCRYILDILFFPIVNETIKSITYRTVSHLHAIDLDQFYKIHKGEILSAIKRISLSSRTFLKTALLNAIPRISKIIVAICILTKIGLYAFIFLFPLLFALPLIIRFFKNYQVARKSAWKVSDQVTSLIHDSLINTETVRSNTQFEKKRLTPFLEQEAILWNQTNTRLQSIDILINTLFGLVLTLVLITALLGNHTLSLGDFVMIKTAIISAFIPFKGISSEFRELSEAILDIEKVQTILNTPKRELKEAPVRLQDTILIKKLTFSYSCQKPLFENLSLTIAKNQVIVIQGKSGSGKSTFCKILSEILPIQSGEIIGVDHCIYLPQTTQLFEGSLYENLTYGVKNSSFAYVDQLAQTFKLYEFMPQGLDEKIYGTGEHLSGGQKQKIALCRALIIQPEILILDESTQALDLESEKELIELIKQKIPTLFIVSHRDSLLQKADQKIVINQGTIEIKPLKEEKTALFV